MRVSLFTPTHTGEFLRELFESIRKQDFDEWVIVPNNGGTVPEEISKDPRVKIYELPIAPKYVGALKRYACGKCTGDILVELDHDDLLMSGAVKKVREAFEKHPDVGFVYSNTANFQGDFEKTKRYGEGYGWKYRPVTVEGKEIEEHVAFKPYPSAVSKIWYAPNHVRAWKKSVYDVVGGHREDMRVLDDQELMERMFKVTRFHHIDECLYLYRITGKNTWIEHNREIQDNVMRLHDEHIVEMVEAWAMREDLLLLDVGAAHNKKAGYIGVDLAGSDIDADLSREWPFGDNSVGVIRAYDFMEHIADKVHFINEAYRVLAHGGYLLSETPSTDGRGAFQDPTHVAYYNEHSFWYYTQERYQKYVPAITARFQADTLLTYEPRKDIPYVRAYLVAIKGDDLPGEYGWDRSRFTGKT